MPRLVHITTVPKSFLFLRDQIRYVREHGFEVSAITSPGPELEYFSRELDLEILPIEMPRRISPVEDLQALFRIASALRKISPDIVHAHTPKGGLLGMMGATLAGIDHRVYHMRGLPMMTATGGKRELLKWTERVSCGLAHKTIAVSHSLREVAIKEHLTPAHKIHVMLGGSGQGVEAKQRFDPDRYPDARERIRAEQGIPQDAYVIGFIGRLVRDKGIVELAEAWETLRGRYPEAHLLIVGPFEERDPVPAKTRQVLEDDPRVHMLGWQSETAPFYCAMDLVTLPSYREGFPNVPLEAAAMELPVVSTLVPGCIDAVDDGTTGALVPAGDSRALTEALDAYMHNPYMRAAHGLAGRARVLDQFDPIKIFAAIHEDIYLELLNSNDRANQP